MDRMFSHRCIHDGCTNVVAYDDEPWCDEHCPESGPYLPGYSARRAAAQMREENTDEKSVLRNVFEQRESD